MSPNDLRLDVTFFRGVTARKGTSAPMTWAALRSMLSEHEIRPQKEGQCWSPVAYPQGATRSKKAVERVSCLVLDFDSHDLERALAFNEDYKAQWLALEYLVHSTHSHTAEAPRWRAVFPLKEAVPGERWDEVYRNAATVLGRGCDPACSDASRLFYLPACPREHEGERFVYTNEGVPVDAYAYEPLDTDAQERATAAPCVHTAGACSPPNTAILNLSDDELLSLMFRSAGGDKLKALWEGNWANYFPDQSRADQSFANALAFYTRRDAARMDRLFRSSGLMRDKWDRSCGESTYGGVTIAEAIAACNDVYTPKRGRQPQRQAKPRERPDLELKPTPLEGNGQLRADAEALLELATNENVTGASDYSNAQRFVALGKNSLVWTSSSGWLEWVGTHWRRDESAALRLAARMGPALLHASAMSRQDSVLQERLAEAGSKLLATAKMNSAVTLARVDLRLRVEDKDLDRDPWLLACGPYTLNLRTGDTYPANPEDYITRNTNVPYDPQATCPTWEAVLERIIPDIEIRAFLQRAAGYSLTGRTGERALFVLHGGGRNGKSTVIRTLQEIMGDYATQVGTEIFLSQRREEDERSAVGLYGYRFVAANETGQDRRLRESFIKTATGQDRLNARRLYQESFAFIPEAKLWLATNHQPRVTGTDAAIWDRVRLIPFGERLEEDEIDPDLPDKLEAERSGILTWAVSGCYAWVAHSLATPQAVKAATETYRIGEDMVGEWFAEHVIEAPSAEIPFSELYDSYVNYCEHSGEHPARKRSFGAALDERGVESARGNRNVSVRLGVALREG